MYWLIYIILKAVSTVGSIVLFPVRALQHVVTAVASGTVKFKGKILRKTRQVATEQWQRVLKISRLLGRKITTLKRAIGRQKDHALSKMRRAQKKAGQQLKTSALKMKRWLKKHAPSKNTYRAVAFGIGMGLISTLTIMIGEHVRSLPNPMSNEDFAKPAATLIYDRNGILLYSAYDEEYRVPISLSELPSIVIEATLQAEDERFYEHAGIDPRAIVRAASNNLQGKPTQGASTITQQLARLAFLNQERTWSRKIDEMILALKIEQHFEKHQILELYFNAVPYGSVAVGIEAASQHYFHKSAAELNPTEAIFLATLTPAPSVYGETARSHPEEYTRVRELARELHEAEKISDAELETILADTLHFAPRISYKRAPHAVDAVLAELVANYGEEALLRSGAIVHTTIDLRLQNQVQQLVLSEVASEGKRFNFSNAAVVVGDPQTGEILSLVGSANYYDSDFGQVNVALAPRQLGSTLKIIPYSLALENGKSPTDIIIDEPVVFAQYNNYQPQNYDRSFHGAVTLSQALANSYNIPALKLTAELGVDSVAAHAARMGISEYAHLSKPAPLSLAIGGVETSLANVSQAYQVVAADGVKRELHLINAIYDHSGTLVFTQSTSGERILSQNTAKTLQTILSDPQERAAAFGNPALFDFGSTPVAIKTGTSNDLRDNVAVAFTSELFVSVWTGNNSGEPMTQVASGLSGATPIMHKTTSLLLERNSADTQLSSSQ